MSSGWDLHASTSNTWNLHLPQHNPIRLYIISKVVACRAAISGCLGPGPPSARQVVLLLALQHQPPEQTPLLEVAACGGTSPASTKRRVSSCGTQGRCYEQPRGDHGTLQPTGSIAPAPGGPENTTGHEKPAWGSAFLTGFEREREKKWKKTSSGNA